MFLGLSDEVLGMIDGLDHSNSLSFGPFVQKILQILEIKLEIYSNFFNVGIFEFYKLVTIMVFFQTFLKSGKM